jgi:hypothetical protein
MFFQNSGSEQESEERTFGEFLKNIQTTLKDSYKIYDTLIKIESQSTRINTVFGQNRQRIDELTKSVENSSSSIIKLGGNYSDVGNTISEIALSSRRNVIATESQIEELFAASKVLGESAEKISTGFIDAGLTLESIRKEIGDSVKYIQNIGGNVSQVYKTILENTDKLNRFNFENGVQGITKMAAQATMLRFNMNETFQLADKVLSPEGAIEVASAFQRLGVAAGNLADPFQLMNMSINDPEGLQDSIVEISKQFTYFDEKTKTFKINPQGILTLREIEKQTGLNAKEMTKLGLASAELDERLSQISPNITFDSEEDRMYLANIGRMSEGGEYEVKLKGVDDFTKLSELSQEQINDLIEEQKDGQKDLVDTARDQLSFTKLIESDLKSIVNRGQIAAIDTLGMREGFNSLRTAYEKSSVTLEKSITQSIQLGMTVIEDPFNELVEILKNDATKILNINPEILEILTKGIDSGSDVISPSGNRTIIGTSENQLIRTSVNDDVVAAPGLIEYLTKHGAINDGSNDINNVDNISNISNINDINDISNVKNILNSQKTLNNITSLGSISPISLNNNLNQSNAQSLNGKIELSSQPIKGEIILEHRFPAELSSLNTKTKMELVDRIINGDEIKNIVGNQLTAMTSDFLGNPLNQRNYISSNGNA